MQKEINFYQEMASEHQLQEYCRGSVPLSLFYVLGDNHLVGSVFEDSF